MFANNFLNYKVVPVALLIAVFQLFSLTTDSLKEI